MKDNEMERDYLVYNYLEFWKEEYHVKIQNVYL